ncbi:ParB N-terminal domain-containing protein [Undibacterium oligocarboniphilum]|uniref:ParB N-terminal domain-containing protein n=1 Tax=Undibacterium oligocarboniphilum TaxID=666702 RepID=A0A850QNR8_9BURK|nr:ParB N-terminal domain-containing protein [Undibacterium oligocarboniphilum]MBC3869327.1 ParB N-terminal domain-containing protein [Undibacterium oligocarboniphilum]NVO77706.1 ParB N-terminal domain-containing protein [Undibacterium oligocarboniphilum]
MADHHSYCVALKPIDFFRPSEDVDHVDVHKLASVISEAGIWTTPVPVDGGTGIVMDGNHRIRAAALLGLNHLPCVLLSYDDPRVAVTDWNTGEAFCVDCIFRTILWQNRIFPYKTTRHRFAPVLPRTEIQLCMLKAT